MQFKNKFFCYVFYSYYLFDILSMYLIVKKQNITFIILIKKILFLL